MEEIKEFLTNEDKNIYTIRIKDEKEDFLSLSIQDDFDFTLNKQNYKLSTEDDFLLDMIEQINSLSLTDPSTILQQCTKEFSKLVDDVEKEDDVLYKGEDVFELENDNNDIKFVDRIRYKEEDFNSDLFIYVFEFLDISSIAKTSRVCKKWNEMCSKDVIWKKFCIIERVTELTEKTWKMEYFETLMNIQWELSAISYYSSCQNDKKALEIDDTLIGVGTNNEMNPWIQATFKKPYNIKNVTISSMNPSAPGGWGAYYLNGSFIEASHDGITWKRIGGVGNDYFDETNEKIVHKVNCFTKYFRIIRDDQNYLGLSYLAFNEKVKKIKKIQ